VEGHIFDISTFFAVYQVLETSVTYKLQNDSPTHWRPIRNCFAVHRETAIDVLLSLGVGVSGQETEKIALRTVEY
jgi:hypothetical protein